MTDSIIVYNKPESKLATLTPSAISKSVDLSNIGLSSQVNLSNALTDETFALVFDGTDWQSQTYMQWEDLRINEALQEVSHSFDESTQGVLARFVASMDIKYQGKKSWVELLNQLGKEIEGK